MTLLILGGTADARQLAQAVHQAGQPLVYSLAGLLPGQTLPFPELRGGFARFGHDSVDGLVQFLRREKIHAIADMTHPYAARISTHAVSAAERCGIPCWRFERPAWQAGAGDHWIGMDSLDELSEHLRNYQHPLLTLGHSALALLAQRAVGQPWLIRSAQPRPAGLDNNITWLEARGPFTLHDELALLDGYPDHPIDVIVSKNSGGHATEAKLLAARQRGLPVLLLRRPRLSPASLIFTDLATCIEHCLAAERHATEDCPMSTPSKPAILFVGHGSRDREAVQEFHQLTEHFQRRYPDRLCATGFLEFARPVIADGLHTLMQQGARNITAVPGMLMAAGHAKNDIPSELNALQAEHEGLSITYGAELGVSANMLQAARDRIQEAEAEFGEGYQRKDTLLVVVGRGASDPDANSNISKITRMLEEGMGFGWAITGYSGVTTPLLPDALARAHGMGFTQVIVFPYFLFTGRLVKKIYEWADDYQALHPNVRVVKAPYLNDHPLVLDTFAERLDEAENGSPNMNCQLCQYRVQIVGNEHKVGMPQEGHHHHVRGIGTDDGSQPLQFVPHSHDHGHHHGHGHGHSHDTAQEHSHAPSPLAPRKP